MSKMVLVVVHPASLCGSFHSSRAFSREALDRLLAEISAWSGPAVAIMGDFSDELAKPEYAPVRAVVDRCPVQVYAEPFETDLARAAAAVGAMFPEAAGFCVTGIWRDPEHGCVDSVAHHSRALGLDAVISDAAIRDPDAVLPETANRISGNLQA